MIGAERMGMVKIKKGRDGVDVENNTPNVIFSSYKELMLLLENSDIEKN